MVQIVLVRPGSTEYDQQQRIQGNLDIPLSEQGIAEAASRAQRLRDLGLEAIYAPEGQPAQQTAQLIAKAIGVRFRKLDKAENINLGLWQGMLISEVRHKQPKVYRLWQEQPEMVCPPEGEMLAEADERIRSACVKLLRRRRAGTLGLVLCEPLLSLARRFLAGTELGDLWKPSEGHDEVEVLQVDPDVLFVSAR